MSSLNSQTNATSTVSKIFENTYFSTRLEKSASTEGAFSKNLCPHENALIL